MERWIVKYSSGSEANATSPSQAKNYAHCDKKATIHHLVEAREKVWVVRDSSGRLIGIADDESKRYIQKDWTCREEWLGGGA